MVLSEDAYESATCRSRDTSLVSSTLERHHFHRKEAFEVSSATSLEFGKPELTCVTQVLR